MAHKQRGDLPRALELYERALKGKQETMGANAHCTLVTASSMVNVLSAMGDLEKAHDVNVALVLGFQETLGEDHEHTKRARKNSVVLQEAMSAPVAH